MRQKTTGYRIGAVLLTMALLISACPALGVSVEETVESTDGDVLTSESEVTTPESTYEGGSAPTKAWLPWVAVPLAAVVAVGIGILFKKKSK